MRAYCEGRKENHEKGMRSEKYVTEIGEVERRERASHAGTPRSCGTNIPSL